MNNTPIVVGLAKFENNITKECLKFIILPGIAVNGTILFNHQYWFKTEPKDSGDVVEITSDTKDVKYRFSLEEAIEEL